MNIIKWLLWGDVPSKKELDRAMLARPRNETFERWARHVSDRLNGKK